MLNRKLFQLLLNAAAVVCVMLSTGAGATTLNPSTHCYDLLSSTSLANIVEKYPPLKVILDVIRNHTTHFSLDNSSSGVAPSGTPVTSIQELETLFEQMKDKNAPERAEIRNAFSERDGGLQSAKVWEEYLTDAYEPTMPFVPAVLGIFVQGSLLLPTKGICAVLGTGGGTDAAVLKGLAPQRSVLAFEKFEAGAALAEYKASLLQAKTGAPSYQTIRGDIMDITAENAWDGAFMNNVLYALSDQQKALDIIFRALKKGGKFVMSNPIPETVTPGGYINFQENVVRSAFLNGAPATKESYKRLIATNYEKLMSAGVFFPPEEILSMLAKTGFVNIRPPVKSFLEAGRLYFAEKP